jgi:hypothetical protein
VIGRFDSGRITIEDPMKGDGSGPFVYGVDRIRELSPTTTMYIGEDVRFRLIGGAYRVTINATGIDVSAVGRGTLTLDGSDFSEQPGRFQINGGSWQPMPDVATRFGLGGSGLLPGSDTGREKPSGPPPPHGP